MQIISSERCLMAGGVSTMIQAFLMHPDVANYDLSSLKVVGSGGAQRPSYPDGAGENAAGSRCLHRLWADGGQLLHHHDASG